MRRIELPADANEKDVSATYRDGVLEVRLPIDREGAKTSMIPVERG
jgi:HSP20 family protein